MRKTLRALLFMLVVSLVLCAFAACDTTAEKTKLETPTVAAKVYTGSKLTATIAESEGYTVVTNEGGTDVGEYDVVLKLSDETKYEWAKPDADDATRVTLKFAVTKATNEITALALDGWTFGETAKTPTAAAKFGTPTFTYGATADGEFSETVPTAAGNYFVKATVAATANYDGAEKTAEFKIAHSNATLTNMPTAVANLVYTGSAQELVTAGVADGGTMQYKLGTDGTWSSDIPTATNAGEYTVYYKVLGDDNHGDIAEASVTVVMAKANSTFSKLPSDPDLHYTGEMQALLVAGETTCGTIWYKLDDGEWTTTIPTEINAVGHNVYYKIVGDDNHNDLVDDETQKLYVTIARANALVTAPTAKTGLTYNGENQPLVNAGSATGATIEYKLGADGEWTQTLPTATNAGEYTVYYKFVANANYTADEAEVQLTITIAKAAAQVTVPTAKTGLTYSGENQPLVNAGSADGATIEYKLGADGEWTQTLPTATNAGEYTVYYKFVANANYTADETESQLTVTIAKAQDGIDFSIEGVEVHCGESVPELTATSTSGNTVTFTYSLDGTNFVSKSVLEESGFAFEDGKTYYVKASVAESDNYLAATVTKSITATHKFETTESNGITTVACACGTKNVSGTLATKQTIDLDATVADGNVSAKGGVLDLTAIGFDGNSMVNLTIGETALRSAIATDGIVALDGVLPLGIYGEQSINVGFTYGKASYNVTINALVVTKTIKTADDYANWITIAKACEEGEKLWGGYFRLGNDISATNMVVFTRGETDGTEGFKGVFDGCGYIIDGLNRSTGDYNAFVTTMTETGVLKNIAFTNVKITGEGNFLTSGGKGTIENVFVQYTAISAGSKDNGTIANFQDGCAMRNVFVDASKATVVGSGSTFRILTSGTGSGFGGVFGVCPSENYTPSQAIGDRGNNYGAIAYFVSFAELIAKEETQSVLSAWNDNGFWIVKDDVPMPKNLTVTALNLGAKDIDLDVMVDGDNVSLNDSAVTFDCFAIGFDFAQAVSLTMDGNNVEFVEGDVTVSRGVLSIKRSIFGFAYGEKNIVITDVDGKTITVSATLVTKTLMNATDYSNWIKIANACEAAENQILGGYFKLGANITSETMVTFVRYDVEGKYGFKGVFDGCGYAIDGLTATGNAFISCMTKDGVLRNIAFTNAKIAGASNFLCSGGLGTIENVYVQYVSIAAGSNNNGTIFNNCRDEKNVVGVIKNVFVDASNAVISGTGSLFRLIGDNNNGYNGIFAVCPSENYTPGQAMNRGNNYSAVAYFASFDELKNKDETQNTLKGWDSTYWTIVDGVPAFVKK